MNYNKLFLISLSLIYSANVFSNTDSLSPMDNLSPSMTFSPPVISPSPLPTGNPSQLGNGSMVESSVGIPQTSTTHLPQPPLMGYGAPTIGNTSGYRTQFPNTDANPIKTIKAIKEINTYLDMTDPATNYHSKLIGEYISAFISISRPSTSTSSENTVVSLSKPFFDRMSKAIDVDSDEDGSMLVDKSKKDIARTMSSRKSRSRLFRNNER